MPYCLETFCVLLLVLEHIFWSYTTTCQEVHFYRKFLYPNFFLFFSLSIILIKFYQEVLRLPNLYQKELGHTLFLDMLSDCIIILKFIRVSDVTTDEGYQNISSFPYVTTNGGVSRVKLTRLLPGSHIKYYSKILLHNRVK